MRLVPVLVLFAWSFGTGIAFICARRVVPFRHIKQLIPFVLRALMYTSGVFFSIDHYVGTGAAASVVSHQPIAVYLELVRCTLLEEMDASLSLWLWGAGWAIGALIIGFIYFWRAEESYGRG